MRPLARALKAIGYLTDPATLPGKAFNFWERSMTRAFERLAASETYLGVAGGMMERGFRAQAQAVALAEDALRAARLPTASDVIDLRAELRAAHEEIEALSAQLELVLEALERIERRAAPPGPHPSPPSP
ncbi:MAG: hypothetical protein IT372_27790 [Polyangiaceae bacterium]|nr:hypothetical protein [Polyangiaceae bacterium]